MAKIVSGRVVEKTENKENKITIELNLEEIIFLKSVIGRCWQGSPTQDLYNKLHGLGIPCLNTIYILNVTVHNDRFDDITREVEKLAKEYEIIK